MMMSVSVDENKDEQYVDKGEVFAGDELPPAPKLTAGIIIGVLMINFFEAAPTRTFKVLYPILYGNAGFSEDSLSILRFGLIPSCLKFVAGYIFQSLFVAPRWFVALLNVLNAILIFCVAFISLDQVTYSAIIFFCVVTVQTSADVITDGHMIHLFKDNGALYALIRMFGRYSFDIAIGLVGTNFYSRSLFIFLGVLIFVETSAYWLFPWEKLPKIKFGPILKSMWQTRWVLLITLLYGFVSEWSVSMISYFINSLVAGLTKVSVVYVVNKIAVIIGLIIGQFVFVKFPYRFGILGAIALEIIGVLCFLLLNPSSPIHLVLIMFIIGGLLSTVSDVLPRTMQVDGANLTRSPTFLYGWFASASDFAEVISGIVAPQVREVVTWPLFWGICMMFNGGIMLVLGLVFFLFPDARKDRALRMKPTFSAGIFGLCFKCKEIGEADGDSGSGERTMSVESSERQRVEMVEEGNNDNNISSVASSLGGRETDSVYSYSSSLSRMSNRSSDSENNTKEEEGKDNDNVLISFFEEAQETTTSAAAVSSSYSSSSTPESVSDLSFISTNIKTTVTGYEHAMEVAKLADLSDRDGNVGHTGVKNGPIYLFEDEDNI